MKGRIVYAVSIAGTPAMPPATGTLAIGATQTIDFPWHYTGIDPVHADTRTLLKSASGAVEGRLFYTSKSFQIAVSRVLESGAANSDYEVLQKLNDEIARGTLLRWYPNYTIYPGEYLSCVGNKRIDPTRINTSMRWDFKFDLLVLPPAQAASTVPNHVMS